MIESKDIQMIDAYRDGKLTNSERLQFENELKTNPELSHFLRLGEEIQKILRLFLAKSPLEENA